MFCHGILNIHETKYGVEPNEIILSTGMRCGFEAIYDAHETTKALICFLYSCSHVYFTI